MLRKWSLGKFGGYECRDLMVAFVDSQILTKHIIQRSEGLKSPCRRYSDRPHTSVLLSSPSIHLVTFQTPHQFPLSQPESSLMTCTDGVPRIGSGRSSTASLTNDSNSVSSKRW